MKKAIEINLNGSILTVEPVETGYVLHLVSPYAYVPEIRQLVDSDGVFRMLCVIENFMVEFPKFVSATKAMVTSVEFARSLSPRIK